MPSLHTANGSWEREIFVKDVVSDPGVSQDHAVTVCAPRNAKAIAIIIFIVMTVERPQRDEESVLSIVCGRNLYSVFA